MKRRGFSKLYTGNTYEPRPTHQRQQSCGSWIGACNRGLPHPGTASSNHWWPLCPYDLWLCPFRSRNKVLVLKWEFYDQVHTWTSHKRHSRQTGETGSGENMILEGRHRQSRRTQEPVAAICTPFWNTHIPFAWTGCIPQHTLSAAVNTQEFQAKLYSYLQNINRFLQILRYDDAPSYNIFNSKTSKCLLSALAMDTLLRPGH